MSDKQSNNKRIAKNTLFLYFRMLFTMGVSLYTSRVVLNTLGVEDYGIYNVVGGVITMFAFINGAMSSATQRFLTFTLGKGDEVQLQKFFSTSIQIHAIISLIVILLGETIGIWFLMEKLVIPDGRMEAAMCVYQCSIFLSVASIMSVPFNADIVAHEQMSIYAYISIVEAVLKLTIVYMLVVSPIDKLISYAILLLCVQVIISSIYIVYCLRHFKESRYKHHIDVPLLKEMGGFAGWSFCGNLAGILSTQGLNMMLNMFFGPVVNAARGIAVQVQGAVQQFVSNFQMALNPQITKNYATGELLKMHLLMFRSARFSFFLLFFLTLPVLLETNWILAIWLKQVPEDTVIFTQIMICISLLYTNINPCVIANQATGKVKTYQIVTGGTLLMVLPLSYVVLKLGAPVYSVFLVNFAVETFALFLRMYMLRNLINLPLRQYLCNIHIPILLVVCTSVILPYFVRMQMEEGFIRFIVVGMSCVISVATSAFFLGFSKSEKTFFISKFKSVMKIS